MSEHNPSIVGKMEAKPLFNVQKALMQPVQMCMLDIPLSVQDDDVSTKPGVFCLRDGGREVPGPHPGQSAISPGVGKFW